MRWILSILIFISLSTEAQVIRANAFYRPFATSSLILDSYSSAVAYSVARKLRTAYTGAAIRVRRSNDNSEQDINFLSSGDLDTASMKTFVGSNNGFIVTIYDQSGNGRNATQSTQARQARIMLSGVIDRTSGWPAPQYNGSSSSSWYSIAYTYDWNGSAFTIFSVANADGGTGSFMGILSDRFGTGAANWFTFGKGSDNEIQIEAGPVGNLKYIKTGYNPVSNGTQIYSVKKSSTTFTIYRNGTSAASDTYPGNIGGTTNDLRMGTWFADGQTWRGLIPELIIFTSALSDTDRGAIETNIDTYY